MSDNKTYYLVMHKWINDRKASTGLYGKTSMLNKYGFSCCLGQFAAQRGVPDSQLLEIAFPVSVRRTHGNYDDNFTCTDSPVGTRLALDLMIINDASQEVPDYVRADMLKERMAKDGLTLIILHSTY